MNFAKKLPKLPKLQMPSKKVLITGGAIIIVAIAGWGIYKITTKPKAKTVVTVFNPFTAGKIDPQYKVDAKLIGKCFTGSVATNREDAWRCMAGNRILDPCFVNKNATKDKDGMETLACLSSPTAKNVTLLHTKLDMKNANRNAKMKTSLPWAVELADGSFCTAFTGATAPINDQRINYGCTNGNLLFGNFNKKKRVWTIGVATKQAFENYIRTQKIDEHNGKVKEVWY